jgi:hypothetical protein
VSTAFAVGGAVSVELVLTTLEHLQKQADHLSAQFRKDAKGNPLQQPTLDEKDVEDVPPDVKNAPSLAMQQFSETKVKPKRAQGVKLDEGTKPPRAEVPVRRRDLISPSAGTNTGRLPTSRDGGP